jgi:pyruvate,water dikinase
VAEDSETASFAGQQETFLNVDGADRVVSSIRSCWASFFSTRALFYRAQKGAIADLRMAVVVQRMVAAEKSGVMFTMDPLTGDSSRIVVEAVFGLGEGIVSGEITPNHFVLDRETGQVVKAFVAPQEVAIVCDPSGGTKSIELDPAEGSRPVVYADELEVLRSLGLSLERCFGKSQDVEWCICSGKVIVLQSRPITTR